MEIYNLIVMNKDLLKIFYGLVITLICAIIVIKSHRLFRLSSHQGIRYFRNAFFFYGIAFLSRALLGAAFVLNYKNQIYFSIANFAFEFFLVIAGFSLLYSLLWRRFEKIHASSLFNARIILFYLIGLVIFFLDYIWQTYYFMFISQILLFFFVVLVSYRNYRRGGAQYQFLKFYFLAMFLIFAAWILNALAALVNWNQAVVINVHIINVIVFLLFLFGVIKITR